MLKSSLQPRFNFPFASPLRSYTGKGLSPPQKVTAGHAADGLDEGQGQPVPLVAGTCRRRLPDGVNISKEARSAISRAASVFVLYATSCANNFAMKGKRKTLNAGDVLSAMEEMEFQRFVAPLKESLEVYRREQKGKKEARKDKDKKADSEEQDKSREEENDDDDERMEEEEQNEEEEVDN
ncbi:PREDICTED: DNA polymerase epsilon subunit 3 [Charadrius vociferus]|uniref:DNA polymerase epsilon subunit 3 n=1 Tax=Charadrius vociferus TaxID=50402 RepID=UPI000521CB41|nr:PREDICTED: DNA polymerase epsilon subunit 3 [Charadrius vociferus]